MDFIAFMGPSIREVIQLSVPSSVVASGIMSAKQENQHRPAQRAGVGPEGEGAGHRGGDGHPRGNAENARDFGEQEDQTSQRPIAPVSRYISRSLTPAATRSCTGKVRPSMQQPVERPSGGDSIAMRQLPAEVRLLEEDAEHSAHHHPGRPTGVQDVEHGRLVPAIHRGHHRVGHRLRRPVAHRHQEGAGVEPPIPCAMSRMIGGGDVADEGKGHRLSISHPVHQEAGEHDHAGEGPEAHAEDLALLRFTSG
jgi:hypothetical protein